MVLSFLWKQESRVTKDFGFRIKCGMTISAACFIKTNLKKQSQFCGMKIAVSTLSHNAYGNIASFMRL